MARILIIDDDDTVRTLLRQTLDRFGHTVIEARDGKEGLDLLPHVNADLLITDIVMPRKGGLAVLAEVRGRDPPVKSIAMSGGGRRGVDDTLEQARSLGAAKVLAKPFSMSALMTAVNELLSDSDAGFRDLASDARR